MNERPIIFSGEMVRAIMAGKKTQTRRVSGLDDVNNYPGKLSGMSALGPLGYKGLEISDYNLQPKFKKIYKTDPGSFHWFLGEQPREINPIPVRCPYGAIGDRLWVRETFVLEKWLMEFGDPVIPTDRPSKYYESDPTNEFDESYWQFPHYQATDPTPELCYEGDSDSVGEPTCKWRPSISMPRWASRITLEITSVRVERVQEISEQDAQAEGVYSWMLQNPTRKIYKPEYHMLWDKINAKRGYLWDTNPWVWVIEFKRIEAQKGGEK